MWRNHPSACSGTPTLCVCWIMKKPEPPVSACSIEKRDGPGDKASCITLCMGVSVYIDYPDPFVHSLDAGVPNKWNSLDNWSALLPHLVYIWCLVFKRYLCSIITFNSIRTTASVIQFWPGHLCKVQAPWSTVSTYPKVIGHALCACILMYLAELSMSGCIHMHHNIFCRCGQIQECPVMWHWCL